MSNRNVDNQLPDESANQNSGDQAPLPDDFANFDPARYLSQRQRRTPPVSEAHTPRSTVDPRRNSHLDDLGGGLDDIEDAGALAAMSGLGQAESGGRYGRRGYGQQRGYGRGYGNGGYRRGGNPLFALLQEGGPLVRYAVYGIGCLLILGLVTLCGGGYLLLRTLLGH